MLKPTVCNCTSSATLSSTISGCTPLSRLCFRQWQRLTQVLSYQLSQVWPPWASFGIYIRGNRWLTRIRFSLKRRRLVPLVKWIEHRVVCKPNFDIFISLTQTIEWLPVEFTYPRFSPCSEALEERKPPPYRPFRWGKYKWASRDTS